jgi:hypothetical protein
VKNLVVIEELYRFRRVCFYTARFDDEELSETEKFIRRILKTPELEQEYGEEMDRLTQGFQLIGNVYGARSQYFRMENNAEALPPPRGSLQALELGIDNRLRIYCLRLSDEVVILLGGGIKTAMTVQESPEARMPFQFAQRIAGLVNEALRESRFTIVGPDILSDSNERLLYL